MFSPRLTGLRSLGADSGIQLDLLSIWIFFDVQ